jgi:hypothetical protein
MFNKRTKELGKQIECLKTTVNELADKIWRQENPYGKVVMAINKYFCYHPMREIYYMPKRGREIYLTTLPHEYGLRKYKIKDLGNAVYILLQLQSKQSGELGAEEIYVYNTRSDLCTRIDYLFTLKEYDIEKLWINQEC